MRKEQERIVKEEVEVFKTEYPGYDSEVVSAYLELLDDYTAEMKDRFCELLGY